MELIDQTQAADWARTYGMGLVRLEPYVPKHSVYDHDPAEYFFFRIDRFRCLRVGGDEVIAVRRTDGKISHCGMVGE